MHHRCTWDSLLSKLCRTSNYVSSDFVFVHSLSMRTLLSWLPQVPQYIKASSSTRAGDARKANLCSIRSALNSVPLIPVQDLKIDPGNGIPYLLDHIGFKVEDGLPYALAQHSGPWHLREAIRHSDYVTDDMEAADIIYVYDHCYYMLWLAQVRTLPPCAASMSVQLITFITSVVKRPSPVLSRDSDFRNHA